MTSPFDAVPKLPHVVRATVVVTMSDGSRGSWVIEGDDGTELSITTEPKWAEPRWSDGFRPIRESTRREDLTFKITDATSHGGHFYEPSEDSSDGQDEIEKSPGAIEQT